MSDGKILYLCGGMQSGGTTLVSWVYLQRDDMDGVFDMENSVIEIDLSKVKTPYAWVKMTVGSFTIQDVADIYADMGWEVRPLLVVRDVRRIYSSLTGKSYGINGCTAEDPPLRTRFRRFLSDWEQFVSKRWPILKYEELVAEPRRALEECTARMGLPWDERMLDWGGEVKRIAYMSEGNQTFHKRLQGSTNIDGLIDKRILQQSDISIPQAELTWLENVFSEYNRVNDYPDRIDIPREAGQGNAIPGFTGTLRDRLYSDISRLYQLNNEMVARNGEIVARNKEVTARNLELVERNRLLVASQHRLNRILNHVVLGRLVGFWSRYINRDI